MATILTIILVLLWFFEFIRKTDTTISAEQHSLTVDTGGTLVLNCSSNSLHYLQWKNIPTGNKNPINVSVNGKLSTKYGTSGRFILIIDSERGVFDLSISNVVVIDGGVYLCYGDNVELIRFSVTVNNQQRNLTVAPINTIVLIGGQARLNCTTSYKSQVYWEHLPIGSETPRNVYLGMGGLQGLYASQRRHAIKGNQSIGQYDLVIDNVSISDAGKYRCIDKSGLGKKSSAELIVLESVPNCSSNVGSDDVIFEPRCGMEPSYIQFVCSVTFHGNVVPSLEWSPEFPYKDASSSFEIKLTPNKTTSSFVHPVQNWTIPLEIVCRVKELENIPNQNHKCPRLKTVDLTTRHVEKSTSTLKHSSVDCSDTPLMFCQFIWKDDNGEVIDQGWRLPPSERRTGERVSCVCYVPDKNCSFELLVLTVKDDTGPGVGTFKWRVLAGIISVVALVIVVLVLTRILLRKKNVKCNPEECCSCLKNNRPFLGEKKHQQSSGSGILPNNGLSLEYTEHHYNDNHEKTFAINSKSQNAHYNSPLSII